MRILLDHCVPRRLRGLLAGHEVKTAHEMGWSNLKNGALLAAAANGGFGAIITVDQNLRYQQNLSTLPLTAIILVAPDNRFETLVPYAPFILTAIGQVATPVLIRIHGSGTIEFVRN